MFKQCNKEVIELILVDMCTCWLKIVCGFLQPTPTNNPIIFNCFAYILLTILKWYIVE